MLLMGAKGDKRTFNGTLDIKNTIFCDDSLVFNPFRMGFSALGKCCVFASAHKWFRQKNPVGARKAPIR